jgi:hypothetical protein
MVTKRAALGGLLSERYDIGILRAYLLIAKIAELQLRLKRGGEVIADQGEAEGQNSLR